MSELPTSIIPNAPSIVGYIEERVDFPEFSEDGPSTTQTAEPGLEETASTTDDAPDAEHTPTEKDTRLIVARRVFYMLMHITDNLYVTVSDRLVNTVNRSVGADSGWTVTMVARQITRVARAHPDHAELLAHLCLRVTERLSNDLYDEDVRDKEGKPLFGGRLFRAKLLASCEFAFNLRLAALGLDTMVCRQDADEPEAVIRQGMRAFARPWKRSGLKGPGSSASWASYPRFDCFLRSWCSTVSRNY
ncbi:hypothetical protein TRAPUB_3458 [Trametes pubescens]|uniref:Uncharacterized protein n=1 Tax=Trametes pubescens TaxID=154538 RepID=A0A1M2VDQ3_TRAPU|nr:hypothetical protein TRAPUB_3458 [Trametes pubescens]